jgi:hypothetical protein
MPTGNLKRGEHMLFGHLILLFAMLIAAFSAQELNAQATPAFSNFEYHVTEDGGGQQEWVTGLEGGKIYATDHWGLSSGGQTIVEGPPFNSYNYQGDVQHGHFPVDISREVFEAVKAGP